MLYCLDLSMDRQGTIRLYPSLSIARSHSESGQAVHAVAVALDATGRRLTSDRVQTSEPDGGWSVPAELHADWTITARGPIPERLFVN